jgi:peptidoglycan/LPS O-acetylase OafA/YrhL
VEEQFYLVWPFVILFCPRRRLLAAMCGVIALSVVLRLALQGHGVDVYYFPLTRLDGLAGGSVLAYLFHRGELVRWRGRLIGLSLVSLICMGVEWKLGHGAALGWVQVTKYTAITGFYLGIVGWLVAGGGTLAHRALSTPAMRAIGRVSYGLYVYHPAIFKRIPPYLHGLPWPVQGLVCFGLVYLLSAVSWYCVEKRFLALKGRLAPEKPFAQLTPLMERHAG